MSDTNRTAVRYAREASYKTPLPALSTDPTVAGALTFFNLRFTKEALDAEKDEIKSEEIRSDRQISSIIQVGQKGSGNFDAELLMQDFDDLISAALQADYSTDISASVNISGQTLTAVSGTPFAALVGQGIKHIKLANCATPGNNGVHTVVSITSSVITLAASSISGNDSADTIDFIVNGVIGLEAQAGVTCVFTGTTATITGTFTAACQAARYIKISGLSGYGTFVGNWKVISCNATTLVVASTASAGSATLTFNVQYNYVRTGTTYVTHVIQKEFLDIPHYVVMEGMGVDTCEMKFDAKKQGMINFAFMGYKGLSRSATAAGATVAASGNTAVNSASNIGSLLKDGSTMLNPVKTISVKISNNLRERPIIGDLGSAVHGVGEAGITGQVDVYFANKELLDAFLNHVPFAMEFPMTDIAGNTMNVYLPSVQASKGCPQAGGVNQDVMQTLPFDAFQNQTLGYTIQIDRLAA